MVYKFRLKKLYLLIITNFNYRIVFRNIINEIYYFIMYTIKCIYL